MFSTADLVGGFYVSSVDQREFVKCFLKVESWCNSCFIGLKDLLKICSAN